MQGSHHAHILIFGRGIQAYAKVCHSTPNKMSVLRSSSFYDPSVSNYRDAVSLCCCSPRAAFFLSFFLSPFPFFGRPNHFGAKKEKRNQKPFLESSTRPRGSAVAVPSFSPGSGPAFPWEPGPLLLSFVARGGRKKEGGPRVPREGGEGLRTQQLLPRAAPSSPTKAILYSVSEASPFSARITSRSYTYFWTGDTSIR